MDNDSWGAGDTETVGACPLCASRARTLLHGELVDRVFFTAPGPWQLWRCDACGAGYLDRRPTPAAIGRAYRTYFTHDQALPPTPSGERLGLQARLKRAALNDYLQAAFGYRLRPALPVSGWPGQQVIDLAGGPIGGKAYPFADTDVHTLQPLGRDG